MLTIEQRAELDAVMRRRHGNAALARRARCVVLWSEGELYAQKKDNCSKLSIGPSALTFATDYTVEFQAALSFKKRWCSNGAKGDIASGNGRVVVRVTSTFSAPSYAAGGPYGNVSFSVSTDVRDVSSKVRDLIDVGDIDVALGL